MASIKDWDFQVCARSCTNISQLGTDVIISFLQVLHWSFLWKASQEDNIMEEPNKTLHSSQLRTTGWRMSALVWDSAWEEDQQGALPILVEPQGRGSFSVNCMNQVSWVQSYGFKNTHQCPTIQPRVRDNTAVKHSQIKGCKDSCLEEKTCQQESVTNAQEASSEMLQTMAIQVITKKVSATTIHCPSLQGVWAVLPHSKHQRCLDCPAGQALVISLCHRLFTWAFQRATKSSSIWSCSVGVTSFLHATRRHGTSSYRRFMTMTPGLHLQTTNGPCFTEEMTETYSWSDHKLGAAPGKNPSPQGP